jgi:hypothetical protein
MTIAEINDALLWLAERQGKISFGVGWTDRSDGLEPPAAVVKVEAMSVTDEEERQGVHFKPRFAAVQIDAGNVLGALLAAIAEAQKQ